MCDAEKKFEMQSGRAAQKPQKRQKSQKNQKSKFQLMVWKNGPRITSRHL